MIATGSRSALYWKEQTAVGAAPSGNWNLLPLNNETIGDNRPTLSGEDIRPDRTRGAVRGSFITNGGNVVSDFDPDSSLTLWRHAIASAVVTSTSVTPTALAGSTAFSRGQYVTSSTRLYLCVVGGTTAVGVTSTSLTVTSGRQELASSVAGVPVVFEYVGVTASTNIYEHVYVGTSTLPTYGLAFEKQILGGDANLYQQFLDCRVGQMELSFNNSGLGKQTITVAGRSAPVTGSSGVGTPVTSSSEITFSYDALVHVNNASGIGGLDRFREFTLTVNNNLDENCFVFGSRYRADLPAGRREVSGRVNLYFVDMTEYNLFIQESTVALAFSVAYNGRFFLLEMPEVKFTGDGTPKISDAGSVMAEFTWEAFKSTSNYDIRLTARNATQTLPV